MRTALALAITWLCAHGQPAAAQPSSEPVPRAYGIVRLGPVGQTVVHAPTRELDGSPVAAPGFGLRIDQPVLPELLVGFDAGILFEGENMLQPYGPQPNGDELQLDGLLLDALFSVRPVWRLDQGRIELFGSGGVGVTWRPDLSGELALTDESGATDVHGEWTASGWGVLAQVGAGATFWLSKQVCVLFEAALVVRRVTAFAESNRHADFVLIVDETHGMLLTGVGAAWEGR
jgi:hypothetical protein